MCGRNGALFEKANESSRSKALTLLKMRLLFWRKDGKLSLWNMPLTSSRVSCSHLLKILGHLSTINKLKAECP